MQAVKQPAFFIYMKLLAAIFLSVSFFLFPQEIKEKSESVIKSVMGNDADISFSKYSIPKEHKETIEKTVRQKFYGDHLYLFKIKTKNKLDGFALLDNVYGKSMPITFLVIFNKKGEIISSDIIKYREPIGGAVSNKKWNGQFSGKNSNSGYSVGKDISTISGATISVHSVSAGIRKLAMIADIIKDSL